MADFIAVHSRSAIVHRGVLARVRLFLSRGQAWAFVEHTEEVVAAGRPTCMWCSGPIDPDGHPCPRMN